MFALIWHNDKIDYKFDNKIVIQNLVSCHMVFGTKICYESGADKIL